VHAPQSIVYHLLMTACAEVGDTLRTFHYLKLMETDGLHAEAHHMRVCRVLLQVCYLPPLPSHCYRCAICLPYPPGERPAWVRGRPQ
jgi:hypothetical protein